MFQRHLAGSSDGTASGTFSVDPTTGRAFVFWLDFANSSKADGIELVQLISPSGDNYTDIDFLPGENFGTIKLDLAEVRWKR